MKARTLLMLVCLPVVASAQQPTPIDDEVLVSLSGDWEGTWTRPDTEFPTTMSRRMSLDGQFIIVQAVLGYSRPYKGIGTWTRDPATGEWRGHWFDNYRQHHTGRGTLEGNKLTMEWSTWGGHTRIIEKVDEDTMTLTVVRPCSSRVAFCGGSETGTFEEVGIYKRKRTLPPGD